MKKTLFSKMSAFAMLAALAVSFASCERPGGGGGNSDKPDKPTKNIEVKVSDVTESSAVISYIPSDNEMMYIGMYISAEDYTNDDDLIASNLEYFQQVAQYYQMDLADVIEESSLTGTKEGLNMNGLSPSTKYYAFAYGIDLEGNATTKVFKAEVATKAITMQNITFTIETAELTDTLADIRIKPSNNDAYYYFDIYPKAEYTSASDVMDLLVAFYAQYGYSRGDLFQIASHGEDGYKYGGLDPNTEYIAFAVGVNEGFFPNSAETTITFKTLPSASAAPAYAPVAPAFYKKVNVTNNNEPVGKSRMFVK